MHRPYRRLGLWFIGAGTILVLASLPQLLFGIPLSEGFAPAGLSLGPIASLGGIVLYSSQRPMKGERWTDDGSASRQMENLR